MAKKRKKNWKDPNKQVDTAKKFWNLPYEALRGSDEGILYDDSIESKGLKSNIARANRMFMDDLRNIVETEVAKAPSSGDGRKTPFITKSSMNIINKLKRVLSKELFDQLYLSNFFRMDTPQAVMCLMPHLFYEEIGIADGELDKAINDGKLDVERYKLDALRSNEHIGIDRLLDLGVKFNFQYINHHGLYKSLPIVSDDAIETYKALTLEQDKTTYDWQTSVVKEPFGSMNGQLGQIITLKDRSYGRTFLKGTSYIPKGHDENPIEFQSIIAEQLDNKFKALIEIETQDRKTGPRKPADADTFWSQIKEQYEPREMTKEAKESFNSHAKETSKYLLKQIGHKLDPWPIFAGITSSDQLLQLRGIILGGNDKSSKEAYSIWNDILQSSSKIETVYGKIAKNTSKGAPYYTKKITPMEWLNLGIAYLMRIENPCSACITTPFLIGERLQNSTLIDGKYKVRHRAIMALSAIYLEQQAFNLPLMEEMKELDEFVSYKGHSEVGRLLEKKLQPLLEEDSEFYCLSLDYSAYDTRVSAELLEPGLWNLLMDLYEPPSWIDLNCLHKRYITTECIDGKIEQKINKRLYVEDTFNYWKKFYTEVPLIVPGGIKFGKHGLFSGAPGTTHIGSLLNLIRSTGACKDLGGEIIVSMFQGDDTLLAYKAEKEISLEKWSKHMEGYCHLVANDAVKQAYMKSTDEQPYFMFVGKYYFIKGMDNKYLYKDIYCISDQISRCYYPEPGSSSVDDEPLIKDHSNYDFNNYLFKSRNRKLQPSVAMAVKITQSIANCKHHPLWKEYTIDFVKSKPGVFKPLVDFGDARLYWDLLDNSGTLIGTSKEEFINGFKSDDTVQLILETLKTVEHEYIETIYTEDIISAKENAEKAAKDYRLERINKDEAKSVLSSLRNITSSKAYNELKGILSGDNV